MLIRCSKYISYKNLTTWGCSNKATIQWSLVGDFAHCDLIGEGSICFYNCYCCSSFQWCFNKKQKHCGLTLLESIFSFQTELSVYYVYHHQKESQILSGPVPDWADTIISKGKPESFGPRVDGEIQVIRQTFLKLLGKAAKHKAGLHLTSTPTSLASESCIYAISDIKFNR